MLLNPLFTDVIDTDVAETLAHIFLAFFEYISREEYVTLITSEIYLRNKK